MAQDRKAAAEYVATQTFLGEGKFPALVMEILFANKYHDSKAIQHDEGFMLKYLELHIKSFEPLLITRLQKEEKAETRAAIVSTLALFSDSPEAFGVLEGALDDKASAGHRDEANELLSTRVCDVARDYIVDKLIGLGFNLNRNRLTGRMDYADGDKAIAHVKAQITKNRKAIVQQLKRVGSQKPSPESAKKTGKKSD